MERKLLTVGPGPHCHSGLRVSHIMAGYLTALLPAAAWGSYKFGFAGVRTLLLAVGSAVFWEWMSRRLMKQPDSLHDLSAVVQGLLFGLILPANSAWWLVILGTFIVIVIAKQMFGGLGGYPMNPVLIAVAIIYLSWPLRLTSHSTMTHFPVEGLPIEPLVALKSFGPSAMNNYSYTSLFMGHQMGGIGFAAIFLLVMGGIYLLVRGFISPLMTMSAFAGVYITALLFNMSNPEQYAHPLFHVLCGMTVFGIIFLASDSTTCPVNPIPRVLYGLGIGVLIVLIRNIGSYADGTTFAILIMNLFHPLIDRIHKPAFGTSASAAVNNAG